MATTERLEDKTLYHTVVELRLGPQGDCASAGLKATGLDVCLPDGQILHYDLEGRLVRVATPNVQWRRGLSHRVVQLRKRSRGEGGGLAAEVLEGEAGERVVEKAQRQMQDLQAAFQGGRSTLRRSDAGDGDAELAVGRLISRAAEFDVQAAREDRDRFRALYQDVPILPPDQYNSLVLLATDGCVYNQCSFCGFYRGAKYRMRSPDQFLDHMRAAVAYHGGGLASRRSIFLGQANALAGPGSWREEILRAIHSQFEFSPAEEAARRAGWWQGSSERFQDISSFLDVFSGQRITVDEFATMRQMHLRRLYLGVETGDHDLLSWLNKPATPLEMLATVEGIKRAGLEVGVIVLIGAGGERFFNSHVKETVCLLNAMRLQKGDYIYLSPLVRMPGTDYGQQALADHIEPLSADRMQQQERKIRAGLESRPRHKRPYVAHYDVSHFVY